MLSQEMTGLLTAAFPLHEHEFLQHDHPRVVEPVPFTALKIFSPCTPLMIVNAAKAHANTLRSIVDKQYEDYLRLTRDDCVEMYYRQSWKDSGTFI